MKLLYWTGWVLSRIVGRLVFRMKIIGVQNVPRSGPFILACNHISYADPPLVGCSVRRPVHYMAKRELFNNRLFGWLLTNVNVYPINRRGFDRRAINTAIGILKSGHGVLVFPEGTRAKQGNFLPVRSGIAMVAAKSRAPVVPIYINGTNRAFACFLGREKAGVIFGRPFDSDDIARYGDDKEGYRKLAEAIMDRIGGLKKEFLVRTETKN